MNRARVIGVVVLIAVFTSGMVAGTAWRGSVPLGVNVDVRMTTTLPRELYRLQLTPAQEDSLKRIMRTGQLRMQAVLSAFRPQIASTIDSVTSELRAVLTAEQRVKFDASSKPVNQEQTVVDTVRR